MRVNTLSPQPRIDSQSMLIRLSIAQTITSGCCDFIAQCTLVRINHTLPMVPIRFIHLNLQKIYRCWIVWGENIGVVIVPSFLSITYIGQSIYLQFDRPISILSPLATWLAAEGAKIIKQGNRVSPWGNTLIFTALATSIVVNALATGLIVFKILKVFLEVKPTSVEQTLGSTGGSTKLRKIIFIIIESGVALFAIQLVRVVITSLLHWQLQAVRTPPLRLVVALNIVISIHQILNVIIRSVHFYFF